MKALSHKATISSIVAKVDGSVGYRVNTPELSTEEKAAIFDLQNQNVEILISPFQKKEEGVLKIAKEMDIKSPSQRMRSVLFLLWKQDKGGFESFETFYEVRMNALIEKLKEKIDN